MSQDTENGMAEKTVLAVFPSVFSANKIDVLEKNIALALKIKRHPFTRIRRNESLIVVETGDPVLASSTIGSLFGIDRIAIAKEADSSFSTALEAITSTSMNLLLANDRFYLRVDGKSPDYLAKDLEVAATAALIEKAADIGARAGSEANNSRRLYAYLTKSHAYVCIFVDRGLGGAPYNSQDEPMVCCVFDELSAIACLQSIKMGFDVNILVGYSSDPDLLKASKMLNRILLSMVHEKISLNFFKMPKTKDPLTKVGIVINLMASFAKSRGIRHAALPILPYASPAWFAEESIKASFAKGLVPWLPLSGMDSSIIENSKQIGLEKYITNLEDLCRASFSKKKVPTKTSKEAAVSLKSLKPVHITIGPKTVYDMIDSLRTDH